MNWKQKSATDLLLRKASNILEKLLFFLINTILNQTKKNVDEKTFRKWTPFERNWMKMFIMKHTLNRTHFVWDACELHILWIVFIEQSLWNSMFETLSSSKQHLINAVQSENDLVMQTNKQKTKKNLIKLIRVVSVFPS